MPTTRPADPLAGVEREAVRQRAAEVGRIAITAARVKLILGRDAASAFFATLALRLRLEVDGTVPTMATDGRVLAFNPEFVTGLSTDERVGCLAHEVMHNALAHFARRGGRNLEKWNIACDLAVNPLLLKAGFVLPRGRLVPGEGRFDHMPAGKSAEEYYALLDIPPDTVSEPDESGTPQPEGGPDENKTDPGGCGGVREPKDDSPANTESTAAEWRVAVAQAEQVAKGRGELPEGLGRAVEEVLHPVADWKTVLREFVSAHARNDYSWSRPNRRFIAAGLYLPGLFSEELGDIVLAIDTSGSVGAKELGAFAAEAGALLAAYECRATVLYHDTVVQKVDDWSPVDGPLVLDPVGGGGTNHTCVFDWIAESGLSPACVICLTDLETRFPARVPDVPVLWAQVGTNTQAPPFGRVVAIGP
ncbi:MAG TPA: VWA-like domain-containing protein [Fimbriiglobus sp.]|jgi:predicted metal-dependent peptidase